MIRFLETSCTKKFVHTKPEMKIFESDKSHKPSLEISLNSEDGDSNNDQNCTEQFEESKDGSTTDCDTSPSMEMLKLRQDTDDIKVPVPTDIPEIDPNSINEEDKEHILGARYRLENLINLINKGKWKKVVQNKDRKTFTRTSESGLV
eukprot:CAMPEP_0197017898 /NCGR_PEP_ID=MMETSP1380-20130617/79800_1 /TAXON_ID=5936 /ORGANISM="Euplotes crassus, Strain CT5" /LENGTH=147 /DNA_ID=CAMNT_0042445053 /DNA_START=423 /DNA_END=866 /DNA_ORIENTATION=+